MVYTSATPLGPYQPAGEVNTAPGGLPTVPCQQQGVTVLGGSASAAAPPQLMWSGERWQQAPDGRKEHDPQAWVRHRPAASSAPAHTSLCTVHTLRRARSGSDQPQLPGQANFGLEISVFSVIFYIAFTCSTGVWG